MSDTRVKNVADVAASGVVSLFFSLSSVTAIAMSSEQKLVPKEMFHQTQATASTLLDNKKVMIRGDSSFSKQEDAYSTRSNNLVGKPSDIVCGHHFNTVDYSDKVDPLVFNPNLYVVGYPKCDALKGIKRVLGATNAANLFYAGMNKLTYVGGQEKNDAVVFLGNYGDYAITVDANDITTVKPKENFPFFIKGETIHSGVEYMVFNDGIVYKKGELQKYTPIVYVDPESLPPDAVGVAVYYGKNLDLKLASANEMKKIIDERVRGAVTPSVGGVNSVLGAGTAVKVFSRGELTSTFSYALPINGTLMNPVGVLVMAVMPVGADKQNKPYNERSSVTQAERYKTELFYNAFVVPFQKPDKELVKRGQEVACYAKHRYPDQYSDFKAAAKLDLKQKALEWLFVNSIACKSYESKNKAYIDGLSHD